MKKLKILPTESVTFEDGCNKYLNECHIIAMFFIELVFLCDSFFIDNKKPPIIAF